MNVIYDARVEYVRNLERKIRSLTELIDKYDAMGITEEVRRLSAKREGVQLALDDARAYL